MSPWAAVPRRPQCYYLRSHRLEIEPLDLVSGVALSYNYFLARQYDLALEQTQKTYNLEPIDPNYILTRPGCTEVDAAAR
jgi:hypothetical protein